MKGYYQYAADVRDGKIVVGEFIKQAVERFYVLFERDDIDFRENRADYAIEFISLLRHYTGRHAGKSFTLLPWQEFAVASIYGFYKKDEDGSWCRLVSSVYIEMARKMASRLLRLHFVYIILSPMASRLRKSTWRLTVKTRQRLVLQCAVTLYPGLILSIGILCLSAIK